MDYTGRLEKALNYDYPDEPYGVTISRLRDVIAYNNEVIMEQREEIAQLRASIAALEAEHDQAQYAPCEQGHGAWNGTGQTW